MITDETQTKGMILELYENMYKDAVDIQSILQILVAKGICTSDEVNAMRVKVSNQPKYRLMRKLIDEGISKHADDVQFETDLADMLQGKASNEQKSRLREIFDSMYKNTHR